MISKTTKSLVNSIKQNPEFLKSLTENEIAQILQDANYEYYHGSKPLFGDDLYDVIKSYLEQKNPDHPILKNIGSVAKGTKVALPYFMGSLDKVKTDDKAIGRWSTKYDGPYVLSDKLDGVSGMLSFANGTLSLYTRGDGKTGQDISHLIRFVKNIPENFSEKICVRGELIISKKNYASIKDRGPNPRNIVAGILNAKKPDLDIVSLIQFVAYELIFPVKIPSMQFEILRGTGLKTAWHESVNKIDVDNLSEILTNRRDDSEFDIDGIVVANDKVYTRTNENPKHAFAFKSILSSERAEVIVSHIEWNISKDKYLKPVVIFPSVSLSGVNIQRATGHNAKFIDEKKIGPGSRVLIIRSGDVIPFITDVLTVSETGKPQMPEIDYVWNESKVDIMVTDGDNVDVQLKNLAHFFEKLGVEGLGPANIKKLYDNGFATPKSILNITKTELMTIDTFKQKSADNLFASINAKNKNIDCLTVMRASNVFGRSFGTKKLELIVSNIPSVVTERYVPKISELVAIKGIEKKTAESFLESLPKFWEFVDDNDIAVKSNVDMQVSISDELSDKKFVFTGFRSKDLENEIIKRGGTITTSVSKNTYAVVCKDEDAKSSVKVAKAIELGVIVMTEHELKKFLR